MNRELPARLADFGLQVAPEKTKIHRFSRFHLSRTTRFTFLGFEFYWEADTKGIARVWRRTSRKKLRAGIQACKDWLKVNRTLRLAELLKTMKRKVRGHFNFFRAIGNLSSLWTFHKAVIEQLCKWLNRRSQRRSLTWEQLKRVLNAVAFPTPREAMQTMRDRALA